MTDDEKQFEELYKYYPGIYAFLRRLGFPHEEAEDLAQEAFLRVYRSRKDYRGDALWGYLQTTARRIAANAIRAKLTDKRKGEEVSDEVLAFVPDPTAAPPDAGLESLDIAKRLRNAIAQLGANDRAVLLLQLEDFSYEEIAHALGISLSAVKSRLNVARAHLREVLGEDPGL